MSSIEIVSSILQPDRFPPNIVSEKKRNRLVWAGQYQQHPAPLEGNLIKRSEVRYFGGRDPKTGDMDISLPRMSEGERWLMKIISCDAAFKDLKTCDYVAVGVIGIPQQFPRRRMLLDVVNDHLDMDATEAVIRRKREQWGPINAVLVEDKANGPAVVSHLKKNVTGVIEVNPEGGKVARFFAAAPEWQAGDWYIDRTAAWAEPFVQQITIFPNAAHDDMADMMSQAAIYLQNSALSSWAKFARG